MNTLQNPHKNYGVTKTYRLSIDNKANRQNPIIEAFSKVKASISVYLKKRKSLNRLMLWSQNIEQGTDALENDQAFAALMFFNRAIQMSHELSDDIHLSADKQAETLLTSYKCLARLYNHYGYLDLAKDTVLRIRTIFKQRMFEDSYDEAQKQSFQRAILDINSLSLL